MPQNPLVLHTFGRMHSPLRLPRERTSERPKVVRDRQLFTLSLPHVLGATTACTFSNMSTSKSGPTLRCFVHFDFEMCLAPQRRALFQHLNFQKCPEHGVFCAFLLRNVLRAATACTFPTSQLPNVLRTWCALHILTSKCVSCHNGVQLFISHRPRRFARAALASLLFDPPEPQIIGKHTVFVYKSAGYVNCGWVFIVVIKKYGWVRNASNLKRQVAHGMSKFKRNTRHFCLAL